MVRYGVGYPSTKPSTGQGTRDDDDDDHNRAMVVHSPPPTSGSHRSTGRLIVPKNDDKYNIFSIAMRGMMPTDISDAQALQAFTYLQSVDPRTNLPRSINVVQYIYLWSISQALKKQRKPTLQQVFKAMSGFSTLNSLIIPYFRVALLHPHKKMDQNDKLIAFDTFSKQIVSDFTDSVLALPRDPDLHRLFYAIAPQVVSNLCDANYIDDLQKLNLIRKVQEAIKSSSRRRWGEFFHMLSSVAYRGIVVVFIATMAYLFFQSVYRQPNWDFVTAFVKAVWGKDFRTGGGTQYHGHLRVTKTHMTGVLAKEKLEHWGFGKYFVFLKGLWELIPSYLPHLESEETGSVETRAFMLGMINILILFLCNLSSLPEDMFWLLPGIDQSPQAIHFRKCSYCIIAIGLSMVYALICNKTFDLIVKFMLYIFSILGTALVFFLYFLINHNINLFSHKKFQINKQDLQGIIRTLKKSVGHGEVVETDNDDGVTIQSLQQPQQQQKKPTPRKRR